METLVRTSVWHRASAFRFSSEQDGRKSFVTSRIPSGICRLRFSFFANDNSHAFWPAGRYGPAIEARWDGLVAQVVRAHP